MPYVVKIGRRRYLARGRAVATHEAATVYSSPSAAARAIEQAAHAGMPGLFRIVPVKSIKGVP